MNFQERKKIILQMTDLKGSVSVNEIAESLQISEITVRRDLAILSEKGLIYRTHGGAMKVSLAKDSFSFANKVAVNVENKDYICGLANDYIKDGQTIFIDCGSTVFRLCELVRNKQIKLITNSLPVVYELINSQVSINLIGGELDKDRNAVHGKMAEEHICRYKADYAFIGTDGISIKNGLSANSELEAGITQSMIQNSNKVILLCDSTKLEKDKYFKFAPLSSISTILTDKKADDGILKKYKKEKIEIIN